jgi:hypothetical protein
VLCRRLDLYRRELLAVEGRESRRSTTRIVKEEKMDSQFWLGVIITVVVGLPGAYVIGILANMHTPRLVHFLESRKLLKTPPRRPDSLADDAVPCEPVSEDKFPAEQGKYSDLGRKWPAPTPKIV